MDMIHGRVRASKLKTMQDAIKTAIKLRNKKISTLVECQTENKRKLDNTSKNNQNQQQPNKRQNTGRAYTAWYKEKKHYSGSKPLTNNNQTRDKILVELTLHGTRRRNIIVDLSHCVLNATITMMVHVLPNATSATELAIWPVTVGVLQIPILLTSKKALKQVRRLHAMNVGIKVTTGEITRSERTKTMKTKLKVRKHVEWCMPLEEEKPNKTLTTLRMRLKLKRESYLAKPSKP
nr:hypothetical protein [Tanacetum cinerariifolium]